MYRFLTRQRVAGMDYAPGAVADLSGLTPRQLRRMLDHRRIVPVATAPDPAPAASARKRG